MSSILIGLGHKARQGKDITASMISELYKNVHVAHWADSLYKEVKNEERKYPLIVRVSNQTDVWYQLLDNAEYGDYLQFKATEVPQINEIFKERGITSYWGMDEKDSPILQFWGTGFRRSLCGEEYWVDKTMETIKEIDNRYGNNIEQPAIILIPDTRFLNELSAITRNNGYYIDLVRLNEDGTRFIATDRDPNHASEMGLDGILSRYGIVAKTGDIDNIKEQVISIMTDILKEMGKRANIVLEMAA